MKVVSKWSAVGFTLGVMFSLFSAIRYFLIYYDLDRAIVYVLIGGIICGISLLYDKQLQLCNTLTGVEDYLARGKK